MPVKSLIIICLRNILNISVKPNLCSRPCWEPPWDGPVYCGCCTTDHLFLILADSGEIEHRYLKNDFSIVKCPLLLHYNETWQSGQNYWHSERKVFMQQCTKVNCSLGYSPKWLENILRTSFGLQATFYPLRFTVTEQQQNHFMSIPENIGRNFTAEQYFQRQIHSGHCVFMTHI